VTEPGGWRPVSSRAPSEPARADTATPTTDWVESALVEPAPNGHAPVPTCIFCDRPSGTVTYAWPDWLCRLLAEHQDDRCADTEHGIDLVMIERAENEADKTSARVCDICSHGWIQRLEDNVRPFLTSMIEGEETPLPPARRKLLARWAAKTAMVLETADDPTLATPRFATGHVRRTGVHPGTQVLVGRYAGERQLLSAERDVSVRTVGAETRHLSQTSLVMGNVLIQVFADPWRGAPPELTENAVQPFIALIGANRRGVKWPPATSIDDSLYDVMRLGAGASVPQGRTDVQEGRQIFMANHDGAEDGAAASTLDAVEPAAAPLVLDAPPAEPDTPHPTLPDASPAEPDETWAMTTEAPPDQLPPTTHRRRRGYVALALVVVLLLGGFGMYERSSANRSRAKVASLEQQAQALNAQFQVKAQQLRSSESRAAQLDDRVSALSANKTVPADAPAQLRLIVGAIPPATDGLQRCAAAALQTASNALDVAVSRANSVARLNASATSVATACQRASVAASRLDGLSDQAKR
jgi:hypothetical protein